MATIQQIQPQNDWIGPLLSSLQQSIEQQKQQKQQMLLGMIQSGQYQPTAPGSPQPQQSFGQRFASNMMGPNLGPTASMGGMNFQYQTPEVKMKNFQDQIKAFQGMNAPASAQNMPGSPSQGSALPSLPQFQVEPSIDSNSMNVTPKISYTTPLQQADYQSKVLDIQKKQQEMKDSQETSKIQNMNPDEAKVELSKNNPAYANYLKGLSEGRFQLAGRSTKSSIQIQKDLANLYPNMDQSKIQARYKTRQDFTTGTAAKNVKSLNTAVSHLNEMNKLIPELHNSGFKMWNRLAQTGSREVGGNPTLARFGAVKTALSGELANIFKNSGGTDQEIKHVADTIDSADSPEALKASIGESINLMGGRLSALQDQWHNLYQTDSIHLRCF